MRLMCLNAWGGRLAGPLLQCVAATDPDVLCLQEVTFAPVAGPQVLYYRGADKTEPLLQRANLHADVGCVLGGHQGWFHPAMRGDLHDVAGAAYPSEFGLATYVRRDLRVMAESTAFVHGQFRSGGWGQPPVPRNAHVIRLEAEAAAPVIIAQMHGLRDPAGKHDTPARAEQAARLVALLDRLRQPGDRVILCGDFNLLPDSATFAVLARLGLHDLVTAGGFGDTRTSHYSKQPRHADYMLISSGIAVQRFEVVAQPEVSDHRMLQLDFD